MKGMLTTKIVTWSAAAASLLCLGAGFGLMRVWAIFLFFPAIPLFWFTMRKVSPRITISILFFTYVLLAAAGLSFGLFPPLMLIGCTGALAAWESAQFLFNFQGVSTDLLDPRLERHHNRDLAVAIGSGLLLAILGLNIHFRLPFGVIAVLAILAVYGLYRAFTLLSEAS